MPTYAYACTACDHRFEVQQLFTDPSLSECPECEGRLRKLFNAVGIVFKGSGFYRTDSRGGPGGPGGASNGSPSSSSSSSSDASSPDSSASPSSDASSSGSSSSNASTSSRPGKSSSAGSGSSSGSGTPPAPASVTSAA